MRPLSRTAALALGLVGALAAAPRAHAQEAARLTIERLTASPALAGTAPAALRWSPDGRTLAFLWQDAGEAARDVWLVARDASRPVRLAHTRAGEIGRGLGVRELVWSADGRALYVLTGTDLRRLPLDGTAPGVLAAGGDRSQLALAPDGRTLSWLERGDLWRLATEGGAPERLTTVGVPSISPVPLGTYARPDVEIGPATWGGGPSYAWSPDGRTIAVHHVDRRGVRTVPFPWYLGGETESNPRRRSYPGDPNERRTVGLLDVATKALALLDLPAPDSVRVVGFEWSPQGVLLIDRERDTAEDRWLLTADPATRAVREVWHDTRATRVYTDIGSTWAGDGRSILVTSDVEDRYRIYRLVPGTRALAGLTTPAFDVQGEALPVPAARRVLYVSAEPRPEERHVWMLPERGGRARQLTSEPGQWAPFPSPDGRTLALLFTDDVTPPSLWLMPLAAGATPRRITAPPPAFSRYAWQRARYVTFPGPNAVTLHARLLDPPGLAAGQRVPVLIGPAYSNTVRNRWAGLYGALQQYLAIEKGYAVLQVDMRGSTGYGRDFREAFLMDWGGGDLDDLEAAVRWLGTQPWADTSRVGLWGSSYGGTLTIYAMLRKPGLFRAGVAGAPATDPFAFGSDDVAIARTPQSHPQTFTRGALPLAGNLRDHLLVIHGLMDDVVPFRTTAALFEEWMRLGKDDVELIAVPGATHGWTQRPEHARYLLGKLVAWFDRWLGAPLTPPPAAPAAPAPGPAAPGASSR